MNIPCGPAMLSRWKLSGDHPETTRGWSPDFLAKPRVIPAVYTLNLWAINLNFVYMAGITSDLAKKSGHHPETTSRWSLNDFRLDNIAGPHGTYDEMTDFKASVKHFASGLHFCGFCFNVFLSLSHSQRQENQMEDKNLCEKQISISANMSTICSGSGQKSQTPPLDAFWQVLI